MIYHVPDDPELGYFQDDEVMLGDHGRMIVACEEDDVCFAVEEADCSICGGTLDAAAHIPLCPRCDQTCRAHATLMKHQREEEALT